ncbi:MAG: hypothetical protein NDJ90_11940 [Oligoflexia bacterium]|nr:hypothetical protein [Oligoflexia bacterium]
MPKLEAKTVQRELDQGQLWPVYWIYGQERMKSRELLKRIRRAALGEAVGAGGLLGLAEETLDGTETTADAVLEAAQSPSLGGGLRFIVIRDAHALKELDALAELLLPRGTRDTLASVCVFLSKDLDGRKKFSKTLVERAAVVSCEDIPEGEREAWIQYLLKRRGLVVPIEETGPLVARLVALDPWSLDIVDQELEKYSLAQSTPGTSASDVLLGGAAVGEAGGTELFLEAFFARDLKAALRIAEGFADQPDESLPLLGLLSWNTRQLALVVSGARGVKLNPYVAERLQRWARRWKLPEVLDLQAELAELDFGFKQTALLPLGLWSRLVMRFCR